MRTTVLPRVYRIDDPLIVKTPQPEVPVARFDGEAIAASVEGSAGPDRGVSEAMIISVDIPLVADGSDHEPPV